MILRSELNRQAPVGLQPEAELLLSCVGADVSETCAARFQALLHEDLNWDEVTQLAMQHGILPLLYWHLDHADEASVPEAAYEQLRSYFYANKLHNNRLTDKLLDLLCQFDAHGITAIPFKGPTLAIAAYGNLDLRQFGDLDILVPERDCGAAMRVLLSQGFRLKSKALNAEEEMVRLSRCAYSFIHDADGISVDLHWGITAAMEYPDRAFALPLDAIQAWERRVSISLSGIQVPSFAPEDLVLILCIHGSKHCWERLGWLGDIAQLIHAYPEMPWAQIRTHASRLGCRRMLDLGITLAHTVCGVKLSESVLQQVRAEVVVQSLAAAVKRGWFAGVESETGMVARSRFYLRMRERWRDKVQYGLLLAKLVIKARL
ncbi:nucleotidyltransferase domain-containing protein [Candidatus Entotheonella palauensis]|uniref:Nucleotidyltransferase family protein n=1 Tax=Candidatus Entotheonella gemina TaxID=1429439 RepID=W4M935_9BACT|nr:nucleotidyltransferase family protein [Candidatus Entotheonella palauensis]ETX06713.1 MAG: hypothetical protein ETSY2_15490 [Candidatus Entotheonella gemina]